MNNSKPMSKLNKKHVQHSRHQKNIFKEFYNIFQGVNIDHREKHFRGKCAEIFIENGKYSINCYFCGNNIENIVNLMNHIYQQHFKLNVPDNLEQQQQSQRKHSKSVENIVIKPEIKLAGPAFIDVKKINTLDLQANKTNERFIEEINRKITDITSEIDHIDIPEIPIQYRDRNGLYSCSFCTLSFTTCGELENHFMKHTNFKSKTNDLENEDNIRVKRDKDGTYHCEICNRKYVYHYNFRAHYLQVHKPNLSPYKCPDCPSTYTMKCSLDIHRRKHTGERPYKCPHCPKAFSLKPNLKVHMYIHLGKKQYNCRYCGKGFTLHSTQKEHERNIHTKDRPYQCEHCGKAFYRLTILKEHWKRHTNTRPYQCKFCLKYFFNNQSLKRHLNTHTGEKSYNCNLCSKKFTNPSTLRTHRKLHSDIKEYKCKLCDKAFAQNAGLYGHMKIYHDSVTKNL